ncbi:MAG: SDR family oxidoreductase [Rhodospirillaceae bacterium]
MSGAILIAGATGNTGRALIRELNKTGEAIRAAALERADLRSLAGCQTVEIDYSNSQSLARALRGVDRVYMAAPLVTDMVTLTKLLVEASVKAGVRHFVKLSCLGASYIDDLKLGRWHRMAEQVVESSGMGWTHIRPHAFMQNFINTHLSSMKTKGLFHDPVGTGRVSYIDVEDIAAVAAAVLTKEGHEQKVYDLTGSEALSSHEAASHLSRAAGRPIRCIEVSVESARDAMFGFGMPMPVVDAIAEMFTFMKAGRMAAITPTVENILQRPPRSFAQFADEQIPLFLTPPHQLHRSRFQPRECQPS